MLRSLPETESSASDVWIDLLSPNPDERAIAEKRCGLKLPAREALSEIQASSRLRAEGDVLYMSAPLISGTGTSEWRSAPTGFILTSDTLITVRYDDLASFDAVGEKLAYDNNISPASVLATLFEEMSAGLPIIWNRRRASYPKRRNCSSLKKRSGPGLIGRPARSV